MLVDLPDDWKEQLQGELNSAYFQQLSAYVDAERSAQQVFPPEDEVWTAFKVTPFDKTTVLLLGQDPYHDVGQAHGLCFSVKPGIAPPPSLKNMYKELATDLPGFKAPSHGYLQPWAEQGILMLNAVLTVRAHTPASHANQGWETFTDAVIRVLSQHRPRMVFALWGGYAQKKKKLIDAKKHAVIECAHPSPLSVKKFMGSKPFSRINDALREAGHPTIDWTLPAKV